MRLPEGPRKLIDMTWQVTLYIGEIAIDVINEMKLEYDRERIIERIMALVSRGSPHLLSKLNHLYTKLDELKLEYTRSQHASRTEYPSSTRTREERQVSALLGAMTRLAQFENTLGEPGSAERRSQINRLWKMNLPVYHIGISREEKEKWFRWANSIPSNKNIHMSSMQLRSEQLSPVEGFSVGRLNALKKFAPNTPPFQDGSWVHDAALRHEAQSNWGRYAIGQRMEQDPTLFSSENQSRRGRLSALSRNQGIYRATIHNSEIIMPKEGRIDLYWIDEEDNNKEKKLHITYHHDMQTSYYDQDLAAKIIFTSQGIRLEPITRVNSPTIISLDVMDAMADNQDLIRLWQVEMHKLGYPLPPKKIYSPPFGGKVYPSVKTTYIRSENIQPGDSLYILKAYCGTIPSHIKYISNIPKDWRVSYLAKKRANNDINNDNEVLFLRSSFKQYIRMYFANHPRFGESMYKIKHLDDHRAGHAAQLLRLISLLLENTRPSNLDSYGFYHLGKHRAYQELQFI